MNGQLSKGFQIKTELGASITVDEFLAEGGQGEVYVVDYRGEKKALKWYKKSSLGTKPLAFYDNVKQNIMRGAPSQEFLWPIDLTEWKDGTFGYVMDLRPEGYYELTEFLLCHVRFHSYKAVIDVALKIVSAFRALHNAGYAYQDLNDGNFFINPNDGNVLICDNDNVAPEGVETGIMGKPRYMAPEIVTKLGKPNSLSDRFSMSIILFLLFFNTHPLEGKRYLVPALTAVLQEKLYGSEPLFIMDPNDKSNGPHPVIHKNIIQAWPCLPNYMQEIFMKSFSEKAFQKPASRPKEIDWLYVLTRFRSEIVRCSCGNEIFTQNGEKCNCDACGRLLNVSFKICLNGYSIPAVKGTRIYRCQLGVCDEVQALAPVANVIENNESKKLGLKNRSDNKWDALTPSGVTKKVASNCVVPLIDGIQINIEDENIIIKSN